MAPRRQGRLHLVRRAAISATLEVSAIYVVIAAMHGDNPLGRPFE
jgi:hypothetical protein